MAKKAKTKGLFIIVADDTPYLSDPAEVGYLFETNNLPALTTTLPEARKLLKLWQEWDAEVGAPDDPPMDFKIYRLEPIE